eukprot:s2963_g3.t1
MSPEDPSEAAAVSAAEPTGEAGTELPAAEGGEAPEAVDNSEPRTSWADLSQDTPVLSASQPSDPAPPIGPAVEETDPALQSLVSEEAAFGASAAPPSPESETRFDALSLLGPTKEEDVSFDDLTAELEREPEIAAPDLEETAVSCEDVPGVPEEVAQEGTEESRAAAPVYVSV